MKLLKPLAILALATSLATPAFALFGHSSESSNKQFTPAQVQQVQTIIHNYLVKNPQVLIEAGQALQKQEMSKIQVEATSLIHQHAKALFNTPNSVVVGNPNGKITLVEFFDYQCPHCRETEAAIDAVVKQDPDVRVVLSNLPIFGKYSEQAATASISVYHMDKSKFMAFHNGLLTANIPFNANTVKDVAKAAGVDYAKLSLAMNNKSYQTMLTDNFNLAKAILEPTIHMVATPAIIVAATNTTSSSTAPVGFWPEQASEQQVQTLIDKVKAGMN